LNKGSLSAKVSKIVAIDDRPVGDAVLLTAGHFCHNATYCLQSSWFHECSQPSGDAH